MASSSDTPLAVEGSRRGGGVEGDKAPMSGADGTGVRRRGKCKWFNVVKGYGFITPDDNGPDVFLHQTVIQMPGFRSLAEGEEVEFECRDSDKGLEATFVCGTEGSQCRGSERRPVPKKTFKKLRCYNCGEFASHIAAKCPQGPLPKRCHLCKSDDHLIADCPQREPTDDELETTTASASEPSLTSSAPSGLTASPSSSSPVVTEATGTVRSPAAKQSTPKVASSSQDKKTSEPS